MMDTATTQEKKIRDLIRALQQESEGMGGYGDITVRVTFHAGLPLVMDVMDRRKRYRFGVAGEHGN